MADRPDFLYRLYHTPAGRSVLKILTAPPLSNAAGAFLDTRCSAGLIGPFVARTGIDRSDYEQRPFRSFNDFFTRRLAPGARPIDRTPGHLIAPCDGQLSVYPIRHGLVLPVKGVFYSIADLLRSRSLARRFDGGVCLVFRLCVDNYHRYAFFDDGRMCCRYQLRGVLHTVRPVALATRRVFVENSRSVSLMQTRHFGYAAQIEVGAMLVGRICNRPDVIHFARGDEKGWFEYGGSTVILLLPPDSAVIDSRFPVGGQETPVRFGEAIGQTKLHFLPEDNHASQNS